MVAATSEIRCGAVVSRIPEQDLRSSSWTVPAVPLHHQRSASAVPAFREQSAHFSPTVVTQGAETSACGICLEQQAVHRPNLNHLVAICGLRRPCQLCCCRLARRVLAKILVEQCYAGGLTFFRKKNLNFFFIISWYSTSIFLEMEKVSVKLRPVFPILLLLPSAMAHAVAICHGRRSQDEDGTVHTFGTGAHTYDLLTFFFFLKYFFFFLAWEIFLSN